MRSGSMTVATLRNRPADVTSGPLEDLGDRGLAVGESSDVVGLDQPTGRGENLAHDGRLGGDRLEAAAAAAPAVRAVRDDLRRDRSRRPRRGPRGGRGR